MTGLTIPPSPLSKAGWGDQYVAGFFGFHMIPCQKSQPTNHQKKDAGI